MNLMSPVNPLLLNRWRVCTYIMYVAIERSLLIQGAQRLGFFGFFGFFRVFQLFVGFCRVLSGFFGFLALFGTVSFDFFVFFCDFYHLIYSLFFITFDQAKVAILKKNSASRSSDFSIQLFMFNVVYICSLKIKVLPDFFGFFRVFWKLDYFFFGFFRLFFSCFFSGFSGFLTFQTAGHYAVVQW